MFLMCRCSYSSIRSARASNDRSATSLHVPREIHTMTRLLGSSQTGLVAASSVKSTARPSQAKPASSRVCKEGEGGGGTQL